MTEISVSYERKFSDGNYGSEGLSLSYTVAYDDTESELAIEPEVVDSRCRLISITLREAVLSRLAQSEASAVAWAAHRELNPPPPRQPVPAGARDEDLEDSPF